MDADGILQSICDDLPEILLVAAGAVAVLIVLTYVRSRESALYRFMMILGVVLGAVMVYEAITVGKAWDEFSRAVIAVAGFALAVRPLRNIDFAIVLALIAMVIAYIYLGSLDGDLGGLSKGTPRLFVTLVAGAFVYMVFNLIQKIAMLIGKVLNCWPFLFVMGIVCIAEGVLMLTGNGSLLDVYHRYADAGKTVADLLM